MNIRLTMVFLTLVPAFWSIAAAQSKSKLVHEEQMLSLLILDRHAMENIEALKGHVKRQSSILTVLCRDHADAAVFSLQSAQRRLAQIQKRMERINDPQGKKTAEDLILLHETVKSALEKLAEELKKEIPKHSDVSALIEDSRLTLVSALAGDKKLSDYIMHTKKSEK